ncbi:hypothetical protein ACWT_0570 [Actinoplanes sp. SE50]|uniref:DNA glycosylase AlkZ-like family protein n=1 Tax=unclassified Actinoplanes TaxID=2626549 RepID=UPI00023ECDE5|nr:MULTISPECIES: crosslink repair DNA glycosylase YcaQ family protein [unclassified Actinoplanes]AEV81584.1 hypothetical protein ACPL_687 [Actinoplanes sp. SE50/110]ATO79985.1 hypothetical protein ACWT_0570 [Actinoplanes sp. SE50]SLL97388.1 hypothetical protein ACSP50_0591 [Actinoplanes sp. SE50/110]
MLKVDRAQVMAYRLAALGLSARGAIRPADLPVLDLGVQDYTPGSTRVALAARTRVALDDDRLLTVWAARGAPHLHRAVDLPRLTAQLWPLSHADAAARINSNQIPAAARLGIEAFRVTAAAMREVVRAPMPRGEASTRVSARVPAELTFECKTCRARHISGNVWQQSGLAGGVQVLSRGRDAMLGPLPDAGLPLSDAGLPLSGAGLPLSDAGLPLPDVALPLAGAGLALSDAGRGAGALPGAALPASDAGRGIGALITTYLRFLGPAGPSEVARYLSTTTEEIRSVWPDGLVEVDVAGRRAWLPEVDVPALGSPPTPAGVRLLPAMDPLLQARDRDLLVPDRERQKEVWRALGNPGVLLLDGEIAGVWRPRMSGRRRVDLTVSPFRPLTATQRERIEGEAAEVARARDVPSATTAFD